ncbi:fumarylacetoacetate hydrolase family protein [Paraliobacillus ryukyuensis]|uniref:fumarylacetoacetate hydrolase family protein n=1 Tax=Paraliobacillus ryukyuensis TaxID=200904 RepID=UPI0009A5A817|nr:fumarylacetoacetate hydrolase family protein [Paraliobacillus ryukyuensis]
MKFVTYRPKQFVLPYRTGFMLDEHVIDLQSAYQKLLTHTEQYDLAYTVHTLLPSDPASFYALGKIAFDRAKDAVAFVMEEQIEVEKWSPEDIVLGPPVANPSKVICIGTNYKDHVAEMKTNIPEYPVLFAKFSNALIGPEEPIEKPGATEKLDYEVELAVVIGKEAKEVATEHALDYVAGYTIGNDVSARDLQKRTPQWLQGKSLDHSTPIGPWLVTTDDIPDPSQLALQSKVNGKMRQSSNTKHLIFDIPYLISFISNLITLSPGDVILTGTPDGVGFAQEPPQFLQKGDIVSLEIEGIGKLENEVMEKE